MTEPHGEASDAARPRPRSHGRRAALVGAVAVLLIGAIGLFVALRPSGDRSPQTATSDASSEVVRVGSPSSGSCLESYDLTSLAQRELSLDGVVEAMKGDNITFSVKHWYKGGSGPEISLAGAATLAAITSAGEPVTLKPGTRLLVSGDGGFAWSCGFTREYRSDTAAEWARTLEK